MAFAFAFCRVLNGSSTASSVLHSQFVWNRLNSTLTTPKLMVTGLSRVTTEEKLREAFSPFGQLLEAKIPGDRVSGRSMGFGFVTYATNRRSREG